MPTTRIGLIGAGKIAESFHLPAWAAVEGAEVVAIADPRIEAARDLAVRFGIARVFGSAGAMIDAAGLDAVDICSPHRLHAAHALRALDAGLHCIIEKPLATTRLEAESILARARAVGRTVMCAQHQRFRPESQHLKELIERGDLGTVYAVRVEAMSARGVPRQIANSFTDRGQSGGGPLLDQGAHGLDIAWWFMGNPTPVSAFAVASDKVAPPRGRTPDGATWDVYTVEDFVVGLVRFDGGRAISIHTSYYAHCAADRFGCEVLGTKAGALWPDLLITCAAGDEVVRAQGRPTGTHRASEAELRHFVDLITKRVEPVVPLKHSVELIRMIEGLYESAESGKPAQLS